MSASVLHYEVTGFAPRLCLKQSSPMDTENQIVVSPEELAAEQADVAIPKEDQVRAQVIEDTGFDPADDDQKQKIDKLVQREMDGRKKLSDTIRTKINYRDRIKKPSDVIPPKKDEEKDISITDLYALQESKVPLEDVEEVKKAAKILNKSIPETLKDEMVIGILKTRSEYRATANGANVTGGRPATKTTTDDEVMAEANKGNIPEKGTADAEKLFWARRGGKRS